MLLTTALAVIGVMGATASPDYVGAYVSGLNETGIALLQNELKSNPEGNAVVSPFSVATAHLMLAYGCRGKDREDLIKGLNMPGLVNDYGILEAAHLQHQMSVDSGNLFIVANAFATLEDVKPVETYKNQLDETFAAGYFHTQRKDALQFINKWVADKTLNRVPRILDSVPKNLGLLLMNAATYDGVWVNGFLPPRPDQKATANFTAAGGRKTVVDMMYRPIVSTAWTSQPDYDAAVLPYKDKAFAMVVAVPKGAAGPSNVLHAWMGEGWSKAIAATSAQPTWVSMPAFTSRTKMNLIPALGSLGVKRIFAGFDAQAMVEDSAPWQVVLDVHEAFIEVDRSGTRAGAATVIGAQKRSIQTDFKRLVADRPFVYALYHIKTGAIAFLGVCADPPQSR